MIILSDYLRDPCGTLSIPYWKAKRINPPPQMKMIHDRDFSPSLLERYFDEPYFRLFHDLNTVAPADLPGFVLRTVEKADLDTIVSVINRSYTDLQVHSAQLQSYMQTPVYDEALWILVQELADGGCVGCGIADFDRDTGELILEWIQVLPEYRGRGVGTMIVNALLQRGMARAAFATVSGKVNNPTRPECLYRKCGFTGNDVWHILTPRERD